FGSESQKPGAPSEPITRVVTLGSVSIPAGLQRPAPVGTTLPVTGVNGAVQGNPVNQTGRTP
ncbi:MAG TPA: hypothetical protein VLU94_03280, partial [Candidatus Nitrosotalea sp.]|nr:hypothetical protein [Candidatus Nitrosotalea sp.]